MTTTAGRQRSRQSDLDAAHTYAKRGDPTAFEALVFRYQSMVLATCMRSLRNEADARDATQETFLKLSRSAGRIGSNVAAWLHACALRTCCDFARRSGARARAETIATACATVGDNRPDPDGLGRLVWEEIESELDAALARLDDRDRDLIAARFLTGRTQAQLAAEAGVPDGTMHRRIHRALKKLRAELAKAGHPTASTLALAAGLSFATAHSLKAGGGLTATLLKIGLSGVGLPGPVSRAAAIKATAIGLAAAVGVSAAAGLAVVSAAGPTTATPTAADPAPASAAVAHPTPRPTRSMPPYDQAEEINTTFEMDPMYIYDDRLVFSMGGPDGDDREYFGEFEFRPLTERRGTHRTTGEVGRMVLPPNVSGPAEGTAFELELRRDGDVVKLDGVMIMPDGERSPAYFWLKKLPDEISPRRVNDTGHPYTGAYRPIAPWTLRMDRDAIRFVDQEGDDVAAYRVIEWDERPGHARVETVCTHNRRSLAAVGSRVRMLVRRETTEDAEGYTVVYHDPNERELTKRWPAGFEIDPDTPMVIRTFRRAAR